MSRILVVGAHGTVGSALVPLLTAAGHQVLRATSRTPSAPDHVALDLVSGRGRDTAFAGVDAAFLLSPPGHVNQHELLNPLIDAARAQGVRKVVLVTHGLHMPRALRAFREANPGVEFRPAPVMRGFELPQRLENFLPSATGAQRGRYLVYEILGWLAGH